MLVDLLYGSCPESWSTAKCFVLLAVGHTISTYSEIEGLGLRSVGI